MRIFALCGLAVATALAAAAPAAAKGPGWCLTYRNGTTNCGFYTNGQCQAAAAGNAGYCSRNPFADDSEKPAARKERKVEPKPRPREKERVAPAERAVAPPAAAQPAQAAPVVVQPAPASPPIAVQPATLQPANSFQSARALILSGKYEAGIAAMKSLGYDDHPDVASSIGFANAKLGRLNEARAWYSKALAADPNHLSTWGYSGALHVVQGELDQARSDLARIRTICGGSACPEYQELDRLITAKGR